MKDKVEEDVVEDEDEVEEDADEEQRMRMTYSEVEFSRTSEH